MAKRNLGLNVIFTVFTFFFLYLFANEIWVGAGVIGFVLLLAILIILFPNSKMRTEYNEFYDTRYSDPPRAQSKTDCLTYYGDQLDFSKEDIISILNRHSIFYLKLDDAGKRKFLKRLSAFMEDKTFKIHDKSGFKEMPVLISATAIQVSFGLEEYLLHHFHYINIHPEEFLGLHPTIRFLEGNVSGNSINISWKYFLHGFQFPQDGKNVGLHEMAHAYHYQNFGPCEIKDKDFVRTFDKFNECGNQVFTIIETVAKCY